MTKKPSTPASSVLNLTIYAGIEMSSLLSDGGDLDGSVDHREGCQHWVQMGVDQVSGFAHWSIFFECWRFDRHSRCPLDPSCWLYLLGFWLRRLRSYRIHPANLVLL